MSKRKDDAIETIEIIIGLTWPFILAAGIAFIAAYLLSSVLLVVTYTTIDLVVLGSILIITAATSLAVMGLLQYVLSKKKDDVIETIEIIIGLTWPFILAAGIAFIAAYLLSSVLLVVIGVAIIVAALVFLFPGC
jgi:hypothetical protein